MARISYSENGLTPFQKLLGHNEAVLEQWASLEGTFYNQGLLSDELKEQVRRTLAFGNGCEYCQARGKPALHQEDERISLAVAFAEVFLKDRGSLDDRHFDILRQQFSEVEIAELCAYICFTTGSQLFGAIMNLKL
ncbi:carboxymuconolactone decarboxylase family protein [Paenibacillus sp. GCM10027628]|uniref:carboxymuconolactone decarboxylase family protein n=1 Tax=Paenibacillus sp. GCM10027628 TaxID=3273413 RepID=UPI003640272F